MIIKTYQNLRDAAEQCLEVNLCSSPTYKRRSKISDLNFVGSWKENKLNPT